MTKFDVIIIGGGPAGLTAAIVLSRCRRKVVLFDHGQQRNRHSHGMHNYLTRDDITPAAFLKISRKELNKYGVKVINEEIIHAKKIAGENFVVKDKKGRSFESKKLILATGLSDKLPDIKGAKSFYGTSIFHCPYCDGWEVTGKAIGVYSTTKNGIELALTLTAWSKEITLYTDGNDYVSKKYIQLFKKKEIKIVTEKIAAFKGRGAQLKNVVFENGEKTVCESLFFSNGFEVQSNLAGLLGCKLDENKVALTNKSQQTNIEGLYVAGDASKDVHFVVVAAAEGAKAGVYINKELLKEDQK